MKINYFTWMANLGVVPLLRFFALRLSPCFAFLLLRLVFVMQVLETIKNLLKLLDELSWVLKWRTLIVNSFYFSLLSIFAPQQSIAGNTSTEIAGNWALALGEQKELPHNKGGQFSIGNSQVISAKVLAKQQKLIVKGKQIGFSDLVIWEGKKATTYHFYVLAKKEQLKVAPLIERLQSSGLSAQQKGPLFEIKGEVTTKEQCNSLAQALQLAESRVIFEVNYGHSLKNEILAEIAVAFFRENLSPPSCQESQGHFLCQISSGQTLSENGLKNLQTHYPIKFQTTVFHSKSTNYKIRMKVIQIEKLDGQEFSFGLDQIAGTIKDLFKFGPAKLLSFNALIFKEQNLEVSTLAEPEFIAQEGEEAQVEVGSEVGFEGSENENGKTMHWKFAGLKVVLNLSSLGDGVHVKYQSELTRPGEKEISGNKSKSAVMLRLNEPLKVFSISFRSNVDSESGLPWIKDIPVLGRIFMSSNENANYKKIEGYIEAEQMESF